MNPPSFNSYSRESATKKPLGETLVEAGLISIYQIEIALYEQKTHQLKIGEILTSHGWIAQETADFFAVKWSAILQKKTRRPLAFYLFAAALLNREQLLLLKCKQRQENSDLSLHSMAVEYGYIKQETVNFFLRYLFNVNRKQNRPFAKPYEIIKDYIYNGKTDFTGLELNQIFLNGVSLKGIKLDNSCLIKASLNSSNLAKSSLVGSNLMLANLDSADLSHTNFTKANLIEANLRNSNLERANLQQANLQQADLRGANLHKVSFIGADLRGVRLETEYSYDVYYDDRTRFDAKFDPTKLGWKRKNC